MVPIDASHVSKFADGPSRFPYFVVENSWTR